LSEAEVLAVELAGEHPVAPSLGRGEDVADIDGGRPPSVGPASWTDRRPGRWRTATPDGRPGHHRTGPPGPLPGPTSARYRRRCPAPPRRSLDAVNLLGREHRDGQAVFGERLCDRVGDPGGRPVLRGRGHQHPQLMAPCGRGGSWVVVCATSLLCHSTLVAVGGPGPNVPPVEVHRRERGPEGFPATLGILDPGGLTGGGLSPLGPPGYVGSPGFEEWSATRPLEGGLHSSGTRPGRWSRGSARPRPGKAKEDRS
jgi:hypothetical protein